MSKTCTAILIALVGCGGGSGNNAPDATGDDAPATIDARTTDASLVDAAPNVDAAPTFGLTDIFPAAASRTVDTALTIHGFGITGAPTIHLANCDQPATTYDLVAGTVTATSIATSLAADPTRVQGAYTVTVTNGDGLVASLTCALHILAEPPPTVTVVVPTTAYMGAPNDNINSDVTVSIQGTGFLSTPNVRWVSTTNPAVSFEALFVGFVSPTQLSATVPSETLHMPVDTYNVFVTNPDNLTGEWKTNGTPGVFTITAAAPPQITAVAPARIPNATCTAPLAITGTGFATGATLWYIAPAGTTCTGSMLDPSGQLLCPITVDATTSTSLTAHFAACPALGPYPVVVINPDGQAGYFYSIEITPSSDGHLNTGPFETLANGLETPRWKHATQYGFDAFSNAFVYTAGGQDSTGAVLGSVEASQLDLFGTPGPFHHVEQYASATMPRVANNLGTPREGTTLVRVGKSLFSIGGTTVRSDVATPVAAAKTVERAQILSYAEMPGVKLPTQAVATGGLPVGSWYYRVSAIGPWGESLATREVVAINQGGQLQVCWVAPETPGTVSYNVYRSLASDGRAGTAAAIAYEASGTCFTDDGIGTHAPAPGNARGTVAPGGTLTAGSYTYRVSAVVPVTGGATTETYADYATTTQIAAADVTAGNTSIQIAWDPLAITGVTYRVYRLDPVSGAFELVLGAGALTATTFVDSSGALDPSLATPRKEIRPLPTGSLSRWTAAPSLLTAREGVDGVVVALDPMTSNNAVGRIIVAGGRDGSSGTYAYATSAESLAVYADGTTDAAWAKVTPVFTHARAYYALLTTQDRNLTPFPPPPEQPPCGDCTSVTNDVRHVPLGNDWSMLAVAPRSLANVTGSEPVYLVAVMGDDVFSLLNNQGRNDFESCGVDATTGHLACGATWTVQANNDPQATFGNDAVLYFSFLYPFYGVARETLGGTTTVIQHVVSAIGRFPVLDLTTVTGGQILGNRQSASTSFNVHRAYYQMARLLAYVYVVGGWAESHMENGVTVPAGPTGLVERHQQ